MKTYSYLNRTIDLTGPESRLDIDSPFEQFLKILIFFFICLIVVFLVTKSPAVYAIVAFVGSVVSIIVYKTTDCTYIIDNANRCLDYSVTCAGFEKRDMVCSFDEIQCVSSTATYVSVKNDSWHDYRIVIVTKTGEIIKVSDNWKEALLVCNEIAKMLAEHFDAEYLPGDLECSVSVTSDPKSQYVIVSLEPTTYQRLASLGYIIAAAAIGLILAILK